MSFFTGLMPLGKFTITAGTTQPLTRNVGSQAQNPGGVVTRVVRQIILSADAANTGQIFLLPAGSTAAANPGNILVAVGKGAVVPMPAGVMLGSSLVLDNFCFDSDTGTNVVYATAVVG